MQDGPDTPSQALALLAMLTERYPATFRHEGEPPKPLAIGITERLTTELALDGAVVTDAMRLYTRRRAYQQALREPGALRVGLDGTPTEPVAPEHQAAARTTRKEARPQAPVPTGPVTFTLDHWKELTPMPVTATLKFVLREIPGTRESNGLVFMSLHNEPKGVPKGITLDAAPLYLTCAVKQWQTACTRAEQIRATGTPALLIVEAHVATQEGALMAVAKAIQVVEGKVAAPQGG
ncbi:MAG TPA: ProQ/FINO family protein [Candidatus Tectomicrobia bacterium]